MKSKVNRHPFSRGCIKIRYSEYITSPQQFYSAMKDPNLIIVGVLTSIGMLMYYWLLKSNALFVVSLMWPLIMALTIVGTYFYIGEKPRPYQWVGIFLVFVGMLVVLLT